jgi:hypothetical protein
MDIGDSFKIDRTQIGRNVCKYPDKIFIIEKF